MVAVVPPEWNVKVEEASRPTRGGAEEFLTLRRCKPGNSWQGEVRAHSAQYSVAARPPCLLLLLLGPLALAGRWRCSSSLVADGRRRPAYPPRVGATCPRSLSACAGLGVVVYVPREDPLTLSFYRVAADPNLKPPPPSSAQ